MWTGGNVFLSVILSVVMFISRLAVFVHVGAESVKDAQEMVSPCVVSLCHGTGNCRIMP